MVLKWNPPANSNAVMLPNESEATSAAFAKLFNLEYQDLSRRG